MSIPTSLAFVDLETTGATATHDRITEIGIVAVDADGTASEWSSLVNPGTSIPPFIESLTGISNAMVRDAPHFEELAAEVAQRLTGRLFIAHNARFDYGFLKQEFARLGISFQADVLCTVKLSRKLFPGHTKHSLDALISRHNLVAEARHRALADAQLIHQFWKQAHLAHPVEVVNEAIKAQLLRPSLPPHIDASAIEAIPEGHGVYLFYGENNLPLYVGKSKTLRKRVMAHFSADTSSAKEMSLSQQVKRIDWIETAGEVGALLRESALIKELLPTHNRLLRRNSELCSWQLDGPDLDNLSVQLAYASDSGFGRRDNGRAW